jgi:sulfate adenylyltransferase subunit 2
MIAFRDQTAARVEMELIVHTNEDGRKRGVSPFKCSSSAYTQTIKTEALRQALNEGGFDAAFGRRASRRGEKSSEGAHLLASNRFSRLEP